LHFDRDEVTLRTLVKPELNLIAAAHFANDRPGREKELSAVAFDGNESILLRLEKIHTPDHA